MAYILSKVGQSFNIPVHIYEADTEEDMNSIYIQDVPMGSKCHIINDDKWYMLNSEMKWKAMPKQVQPDWNQNDDTAADYIKNKPLIAISFKPAGKSYLTFSSSSSFTLAVNDATKHWDGTLEYFSSDKTWTVWDGTTTLSAIADDGEYVLYLRGTGNTVITGNNENYRWVLTGSDIACIGNIENLLDYATVASGAHPTMATYCYRYMFYGCTSLTNAPDLPATKLANYCYSSMFQGCASLAQTPALPATTLVDFCYTNMFYGCTALAQAPALPATALAINCYQAMFQGCTSLTNAPSLPATTLADWCYNSMFFGCTSLTNAPSLPATALVDFCYRSMFQGCTSLTQAPALPATTLANICYQRMFYGCTGLTQVPALPAMTLTEYCYRGMFQGCTSLKLSSTKTGEYTQEYRIPSSGEGVTARDALADMFTSTGGAFTGTPSINTTYYLSSDNMIVRETEIDTLNGYVDSMIDVAIDKYNGMTPVECVFPPLFDGGSESSRIFYVKQGVINPVDYKTVTDDIKTAWINFTFLTDATVGKLSSYQSNIKGIAPLIEIGVFGEDFFNTVTYNSPCVFFDDPITQRKKITIYTYNASKKSFSVIVDGPNGFYATDAYSILNDEFSGGRVYDQHLRPYSNNANDTNLKLGQLEMEAAPTKDMQIATKKYVDDSVSNPLNITGATVGQIAKITAVDDSGNPTAWEAVDMPSGGGGGGITTLHINITDINAETKEPTFTADKTPAEMLQAAATGPIWCVVSFAAGLMGEEAVSFGVPPTWGAGAPTFGTSVSLRHQEGGNNEISDVVTSELPNTWILDLSAFG